MTANQLTRSPMGPTWTAAALEDYVLDLRARRPNLSAEQASTLLQFMARRPLPPNASPTQPVTDSAIFASPADAAGPILRLTQPKAGYSWYVVPDGRYIDSRLAPNGIDPVTFRLNPPPPKDVVAPDTKGYYAVVADGVTGTLLGLWLIGAAAGTLAKYRGSARWLRAWSYFKFAAIAWSLIATAWWARTAPDNAAPIHPSVFVGIAAQLVVPIVILSLVGSEAARLYYAANGEPLFVFDESRRRTFGPTLRRTVGSPAGRASLRTAAAVAALITVANLVQAVVGLRAGTASADDAFAGLMRALFGVVLAAACVLIVVFLGRGEPAKGVA